MNYFISYVMQFYGKAYFSNLTIKVHPRDQVSYSNFPRFHKLVEKDVKELMEVKYAEQISKGEVKLEDVSIVILNYKELI